MHPIEKRFRENAQGFLRLWWPLLAVYFVALAADGFSTVHFMRHEGVDSELHPAVNLVSHIAGPILGPIIGVFGKAVAGLIVAIYWRRIAWMILLIPTLLSFWAAWYNLWGWQYYQASIYLWWPF
jgi:hypothetical protein